MNQQPQRPIRFGDVYFMRFTGTGSEQNGWRPGVVFSNNVGNAHSPNIIALPMTTAMKKLGQPTHVLLPESELGLGRDSLVLCENPERMDKRRIGEYIASLSPPYLADIAAAFCLATSAVAFLSEDRMIDVWNKAVSLNASPA